MTLNSQMNFRYNHKAQSKKEANGKQDFIKNIFNNDTIKRMRRWAIKAIDVRENIYKS